MILAVGCIGALTVGSAQGELKTWRIGKGGEDWSAKVESMSGIDFESSPGSIQPRELKPGENLALRLKWKDGRPKDFTVRGEPRVWHNLPLETSYLLRLVDGDPTTSTEDRFKEPMASYTGVSFYFDFGEPLAISRIRFYPRQEGKDQRGYYYKDYFMKGFEIFVSDGYSFTSGGQPEFTLLESRRRNKDTTVVIYFSPRPVRFVRIRASVPDRFEIAEVEFYGAGFSTEAEYLSEVIDLGEKANLGKIAWEVSKWRRVDEELIEAPDADVSIKVEGRNGIDPTPKMYFAKGDTVEVTEEEYNSLKPEERGSIKEDRENWSPWFPLTSGEAFPSFGPRRYFQFRIRLHGTRTEMLRVESLSLEYSVPLLAEKIVGEVALFDKPAESVTEVEPGKDEVFTYDVRADFTSASQKGFDCLKIEVPTKPSFEGFEIGGSPVEPDSVYVNPEPPYYLEVFFPSRRITIADNLPIRVTLRASVLMYGEEFRGYALDTQSEELPQLIEPGDANPKVGTNSLRVFLLKEVAGRVLSNFDISPMVTPNGDEVNDKAIISYAITQLDPTFGRAEVKLGIYDLTGRLVREFSKKPLGNGIYQERWDGKDEGGKLVNPGLYLCTISVKTDRQTFRRTKSVVVVY